MNDNLHQLRCFGCGTRAAGTEARPDFRCSLCGDLFEVEYPGWRERRGPDGMPLTREERAKKEQDLLDLQKAFAAK